MSEHSKEIIALGEKIMAVLAEHTRTSRVSRVETFSTVLSAVSYVAGRSLANFLDVDDDNGAIAGAMIFREQTLGHIATRWVERKQEERRG